MPRFDDQPHCDCSFFVTKPMIDVPASTNGFELVIASTSEDLPSDFRLKLERNLASNLPADQALAEVSQLDATTQTARSRECTNSTKDGKGAGDGTNSRGGTIDLGKVID